MAAFIATFTYLQRMRKFFFSLLVLHLAGTKFDTSQTSLYHWPRDQHRCAMYVIDTVCHRHLYCTWENRKRATGQRDSRLAEGDEER